MKKIRISLLVAAQLLLWHSLARPRFARPRLERFHLEPRPSPPLLRVLSFAPCGGRGSPATPRRGVGGWRLYRDARRPSQRNSRRPVTAAGDSHNFLSNIFLISCGDFRPTAHPDKSISSRRTGVKPSTAPRWPRQGSRPSGFAARHSQRPREPLSAARPRTQIRPCFNSPGLRCRVFAAFEPVA